MSDEIFLGEKNSLETLIIYSFMKLVYFSNITQFLKYIYLNIINKLIFIKLLHKWLKTCNLVILNSSVTYYDMFERQN